MTINTNYLRWLLTILYVKSPETFNSMGIIAKRISLVKKKLSAGHAPSKLNIAYYFATRVWSTLEPALDQAFGLLVSVS